MPLSMSALAAAAFVGAVLFSPLVRAADDSTRAARLQTYKALAADSTGTLSVGIYGGFGPVIHSADFRRLPDCPGCSPGFRSGSGSGLSLGLVADKRLSPLLWLYGRLAYTDLSATLERREATTIIVNNRVTPGEFTHTLTTTLGAVGIEPGLKLSIVEGAFLNAGIFAGFFTSTGYSQVEKITQPELSGTFVDQFGNDTYSRERNRFSGELQKINSFYIAPVVSFSYQLPMNAQRTLLLEPEISYTHGLANLVADDLVPEWTAATLRGGISLKYRPSEAPTERQIIERREQIDTVRTERDDIAEVTVVAGEERLSTAEQRVGVLTVVTETVRRTDTLVIPKRYLVSGSIRALGVEADGREVAAPVFRVEEFISNRLDPLLNYVFFAENSAEIPRRYNLLTAAQAAAFNEKDLFRDSTLSIYHNMLNIVGKRLRANPSATVELVGCNADHAAEQGNTGLSAARAQSVKNYLVSVWEIAPERVKVSSRNLPEKASTPNIQPDRAEENRRVEMYSSDRSILAPLFVEKIDRTANPPIARFSIAASSPVPFTSWSFRAYQESDTAAAFTASGTGPIPSVIDWQLDRDQNITPKAQETIRSSAVLYTEKTGPVKIQGNPLEVQVVTVQQKRKQIQGDYEIERFSMILFDFDNAEISAGNAEILRFIASRIKPESAVTITGYTDSRGADEYLRTLSLRRANAAKAALGRSDATTLGFGKDAVIYDNDLPEGRFYCRTVVIEAKTPIR